MQHDQQNPNPPSRGWIAHIVLAFACGVALTGLVIGYTDKVEPVVSPALTDPAENADHSAETDVPIAPVYAQIRDARFGPNANWRSVLPEVQEDPTVFYGDTPADPAERQAAVHQRLQRRAYEGAPPVVPHAIDQTNPASCLACHEQGVKVGDVIAPRMSHQRYTNCTQCHVESTNRALPPWVGPRVGDNRFQGLTAPGPGERAWPGAPPTIPHTTWMRENCNSCHGTLGREGLRTSHPWRANCVQCHAPSADLDQRHVLDAARPPVVSFPPED